MMIMTMMQMTSDENDHDDYHDYHYEYDAGVHYDDGRYCDVCMMMLVRAMVLVAR